MENLEIQDKFENYDKRLQECEGTMNTLKTNSDSHTIQLIELLNYKETCNSRHVLTEELHRRYEERHQQHETRMAEMVKTQNLLLSNNEVLTANQKSIAQTHTQICKSMEESRKINQANSENMQLLADFFTTGATFKRLAPYLAWGSTLILAILTLSNAIYDIIQPFIRN